MPLGAAAIHSLAATLLSAEVQVHAHAQRAAPHTVVHRLGVAPHRLRLASAPCAVVAHCFSIGLYSWFVPLCAPDDQTSSTHATYTHISKGAREGEGLLTLLNQVIIVTVNEHFSCLGEYLVKTLLLYKLQLTIILASQENADSEKKIGHCLNSNNIKTHLCSSQTRKIREPYFR